MHGPVTYFASEISVSQGLLNIIFNIKFKRNPLGLGGRGPLP